MMFVRNRNAVTLAAAAYAFTLIGVLSAAQNKGSTVEPKIVI